MQIYIKEKILSKNAIFISFIFLISTMIGISISLGIYYVAFIPIFIISMTMATAIYSEKNQNLENVLIYSFIFYFVASLLWPRYVALWLPGLPSINLQRIATALSLGAIVVALFFGNFLRIKLSTSFKANPIFWIGLILFVIFRLLSIFTSRDAATSTYQFINEIFVHIIFVISGVVIGASQIKSRWFSLGITICFYIAFLVGIMEYFQGENLFGSFVDPTNAYVQWALSEKVRGGGYRAQSTFGHPLTFSEFASVGFCFAIFMAMQFKSTFNRISGVLASFVCGAGAILISGSRAGYGVFAITVAAMAISPLINSIARRRLTLRIVTGWTFLLIILFVLFSGIALVVYDYGFGTKSYAISNNARAMMYERGLSLAVDSPILGYGVGLAPDAIGIRSGNGVSQYTIDSLMLSFLVDSGFIALTMFLLISIIAIRNSFVIAVKGEDKDWFFWYVVGVSIFSMILFKCILSLPDNNFLLFSLLGFSVSFSRFSSLRDSRML